MQLTPPGSACSIAIGTGLTDMPLGSREGLQMVVAKIEKARDELVRRSAAGSEIEVMLWGSFNFFNDPEGNAGALQGLPPRS